MTAKKREGFAARLLEESKVINEGLRELDLAQESDPDKEVTEAAKEAYLLREIESRNEKIKELSESQEALLGQIKEFEQENLQYASEVESLKERLRELENEAPGPNPVEKDLMVEIADLREENARLKASSAPLDLGEGLEPTLPAVDMEKLTNDLKTYSPLFARGSVSHSVSDRSYTQMRDMMRYLEGVAPVKRIREAEFWNISIWLMYSVFHEVKDRPSMATFEQELQNSTDATDVLLQFYLILLAHLGIDHP